MQDKYPLVSVFVILGKDENYNQMILDSIESQTYPNIEIIKNTPDLRKAHGDYILITTCYDWYDPDAIIGLMTELPESKLDVVLFNMERHFESGGDVRLTRDGGANSNIPFVHYEIEGTPQISPFFLANMNPHLGACFFKRDFLVRHNLMTVGHPNAFVRQVLINKPDVFILTSNMGHHIVVPGIGPQNQNDFIATETECFNYLYRYTKSLFWLRKWRKPLKNIIFSLAATSPVGILSKVRPQDFISQVSIHLVDHCNLNCKSCSHFSCLARAGDFELDIKDFKRDIRRLRRVTRGRVNILELYGGEPLLHPNVLPFMKYARRAFPRALIRFITNGILLPQQKPEFWETVHRYKILISPTKYPINIDWDTIIETANKYHAELDFFGGTGYCQKTLYHKPLDIFGTQNPAHSFINCQHTGCINLYKGRLYHCPVAAYIKYFNRQFKTNLKLSAMDSLDIHERGLRPNDVFEFIARPIPFCRYCLSHATTRGHPWETTKKDISEWTLLRKK